MKDKIKHNGYQLYNRICSCNQSFLGQNVQNANIRWDEYSDVKKDLALVIHLKDNENHKFT